jgi:hypothetical protein
LGFLEVVLVPINLFIASLEVNPKFDLTATCFVLAITLCLYFLKLVKRHFKNGRLTSGSVWMFYDGLSEEEGEKEDSSYAKAVCLPMFFFN